jgi:hypothetical protein
MTKTVIGYNVSPRKGDRYIGVGFLTCHIDDSGAAGERTPVFTACYFENCTFERDVMATVYEDCFFEDPPMQRLTECTK